MQTQTEKYSLPDATGHFGQYGGVFVAETLQAALRELNLEYEKAKADPAFIAEFHHACQRSWAGRRSTSSART